MKSKIVLRCCLNCTRLTPISGLKDTVLSYNYCFIDCEDLVRNMGILAVAGKPVHTNVGRWHFLSIFTGGGLAGNIGMVIYYLMHRNYHNDGLRELLQLSSLANISQQLKHEYLMTVFDTLNLWISFNGASAGINAILSFGACYAIENMVRIHRQHRHRYNWLEIEFSNAVHVLYILHSLYADVAGVIASFSVETGLFDEVLNQTKTMLACTTRVGGMVFGVAYYFAYRRKHPV